MVAMPELVANMIQAHPYRVRDGAVEHLLLRRSEHETYGAGLWQVVTGGIEPGERSADATRRELAEETGLAALRIFALPGVATFYFEPTDQVITSPMFGCQLAADAVPTLSAEHADYRWLAAHDALALLRYPTHHQGVRELEQWLADLRNGL